MKAPDGQPCGRDELLSQPCPHDAGAIVTPQGGELADAGLVECGSGRIRVEDCGRALAVERAHVADELWESEMDEAVELPRTVAEILDEPLMAADELPQVVERAVPGGGGGALLGAEAGDAQGIDAVRLRPHQVLLLWRWRRAVSRHRSPQ